MVTRADVARLAGVSTAVVSYVVNDGPRPVAADTAARVREAIEMLGYRPNASARALKLGTTGVLGLVVPDSSNPFYAELALEVERSATRRGLALLVASSNSDLELESRLIQDLASRQVDGLLVSAISGPPRITAGASRIPVPLTYLDAQLPVEGVSTVSSDGEAGARMLVQHLLRVHGHSTVALLMGTASTGWVDGRELGWQRTLREHGAPDAPLERAPFSRKGGYEGGLRLLRGRGRPAAVFASSDLQAIGLLRAAHELGIAVPGELAVVAYDGTEESEYCWPPLTCARQRIADIAEAAVNAVLDGRAPTHRVFDVDLLIRRSCGCTGEEPGELRTRRARPRDRIGPPPT
ncbi:LacI family DNA-binding transcriptional regulator [Microlunatus ginsengisoli]|uniref:LacI family DNA-binding transcriptional regulator n=1 Tax=Microlunatus ginsengisoli TaxID=363863 RepID=UPI0031E37814